MTPRHFPRHLLTVLVVAATLSSLGCHLFEHGDDDDDEPCDLPLLALSVAGGHELSGAFQVGLPLPRNTPTQLGVIGLSVPQQMFNGKVHIECQLELPEGVRAPKRFVIDWNIRDGQDGLLDEGKIKLRVREDLSCRPRTAKLSLARYPSGATLQASVTAKKRDLAVGTVIVYEIGIS